MGYAFSHLVFAWIIGKLYEFFSRKKIKQLFWAFFLFGAILPDADLLINWIFDATIHRTFTHSIIFILITFGAIFLLAKLFKQKNKAKSLALAMALGICMHLILDLVFGAPGIQLLWPLDKWFWFFGMGSYTIAEIIALSSTYEAIKTNMAEAIIDMGIGVCWIGYFWFRKKIKF